MIYILDNGLPWSDHCMVFIQTNEPFHVINDLVTALVATDYPSHNHWKIVGESKDISWRDSNRTCTLAQWFPVDCIEDHPEIFHSMNKHFWKEVLTVNDKRDMWIDPDVRAEIEAHLRS